MLDLKQLRKKHQSIIAIGSHPGILQSMMDFEFLCGKKEPTLKGIIASGKKTVLDLLLEVGKNDEKEALNTPGFSRMAFL